MFNPTGLASAAAEIGDFGVAGRSDLGLLTLPLSFIGRLIELEIS